MLVKKRRGFHSKSNYNAQISNSRIEQKCFPQKMPLFDIESYWNFGSVFNNMIECYKKMSRVVKNDSYEKRGHFYQQMCANNLIITCSNSNSPSN